MDRRRANPYVKAYAFPAEGSSALAAERRASAAGYWSAPAQPAMQSSIRRRVPVQGGLHVPAWVVYLVVAGAVFAFMFSLVHMRAGIADAKKQVVELGRQVVRAEEMNRALEEKIDNANDPERIHTVATNWLKMRIPSPDEVQTIPYFVEIPQESPYKQPSEGGFIRLLLSFFFH